MDSAMKFKIAIFHTTLPQPDRKIAGVESTVHRLANALVESGGVSVTVFSCDPKPLNAAYEHVELFPRSTKGFLKRFIWLPFALNFVDFSKYDILHLHGDDWFFVNRRLPTIRSMHGSALREAQRATSLKRKAVQYLLFFFERLSVLLATTSLAGGEETQRIYGIQQLDDIYGVDNALFKPQSKSPTPLIFYVGTWGGRKRGEMAFNTFVTDILPAFPTAKLYMASDFVPDHPAVIDGGFPSDLELADWMSRSWMFLYPSSYEGYGIPYIEAMASGTTIVTTSNGGAEYVLAQGRYGCITNDNDFGASAVSLMGESSRREQYQEAGIVRAKHFFWDQVAARHVAIYQTTIAKAGSRREGEGR